MPGEDASGISGVEGRATAEDYTVHQAAPTMRNCPAPNVNSSEVENLAQNNAFFPFDS